jgi:predicted metalloprotease with PDZ domain
MTIKNNYLWGMRITFSYTHPERHFLTIQLSFIPTDSTTTLQLPAWRPGRYELGNFAKNIREFSVTDANGNALSFEKITKDSWAIQTPDSVEIIVSYRYYANVLNAGSTYLDEHQLYVNPVNCTMFINGSENMPVQVVLPISKGQMVAGLSDSDESGVYHFNSFHDWVDSPFMISSRLQYQTYVVKNTTFHIWFNGVVKPKWENILPDFEKFTTYQMAKFGDIPTSSFHFLFQITTYGAYHGVEHLNSTVLLLGPSYAIFDSLYTELLGLCSHELYHVWNIKTIRPTELLPYRYEAENYFRTGYVAEGVTTYMGDRILYECGVFDRQQYNKELLVYITKHFHNDGRHYFSVAESSHDTWVDGYEVGIPGRKTSIYTEGCLIAYICDMRIRKQTHNQKSLHTVMAQLYRESATGYTHQRYIEVLEENGNCTFKDIVDDLIFGKASYLPYLEKALAFDGYELKKKSPKGVESTGFKLSAANQHEVISILENSAAYQSGLVEGDLIESINEVKVSGNVNEWLNYFSQNNEPINLTIARKEKIFTLQLSAPNEFQYYTYELKEIDRETSVTNE